MNLFRKAKVACMRRMQGMIVDVVCMCGVTVYASFWGMLGRLGIAAIWGGGGGDSQRGGAALGYSWFVGKVTV
jgi:hypothetical protein